MNTHEFLDDDLRDQAVRHALGSLSEPEARAYRVHLAHCEVCRAETESLAEVTRDLVLLAPSKAPPAPLWDRVLKRIKRQHFATQTGPAIQVWKDWAPTNPGGAAADDAGLTYVPGAGEPFQSTGAPGVDVRRLFVDHEERRVTLLVRMAAGSSYPAHEHASHEECYVLQGDLRVGDLHMHAGDFQRAEAGSVHGTQATDDGCVLMIVSSLDDRFVS
jgi:anti-sigma factor ChrR (cupin superfamily)